MFMRKGIMAGALLAVSAAANAAVITSEDFESGATGWSDNTTTTGTPTFTTFLGRFGGTAGAQTVFKTYALSGAQTQVTIQFDFYEIDSWDNEQFRVFVDDTLLYAHQYQYLTADDPDGPGTVVTPLTPTLANRGFGPFNDQTFRYSFTYNTTATTLKLGFGSTLNQAIDDESWGIDNVVIADNAGVPIPAPMALPAGLLLLGAAALSRRRRS